MASSVSFGQIFDTAAKAEEIDVAEGFYNYELPRGERKNKNTPTETKVLAIDLDGTLLKSDHTLPLQAAQVLAAVREAGIRIILASARPPRSVLHIQEQLKLDGPVVALNGAWIGSKDGEILAHPIWYPHWGDPFQEDSQIQLVLARHRELGVVVNLFTKEHWATSDINHPLVQREIEALGYPPDGEISADVLKGIILKMSVLGPMDALSTIRGMLKRFHLPTSLSNPFQLEITGLFTGEHRRPPLSGAFFYPVCKSEAVRFLLERDGLRLHNALALGDGQNDGRLLASSGHGVSFFGADEWAIHCADEIIIRDPEQTILPYLRELYRLSC
ncbi:MAG: HAD family hydrolase [Bdellovibrionota bacterium]|nr:MAG: HAD family hydrolase [Bdellovibrionota bacterium]